MLSAQTSLRAHRDRQKAAFFQRFFKTGPGQYAEHDVFLGLSVPQVRTVAKTYSDLSPSELRSLIHSEYHEERLLALLILVDQYRRGDAKTQQTIFHFYLQNLDRVNNWDLVDSSADKIIGARLSSTGDTSLLDELATSKNLWHQRVAIIATFFFIRQNRFEPTLSIAAILVHHPHDLIHKAVGWMLREVGKRDLKAEQKFLDKHAATMPRTMLRYAIEKFEPDVRRHYLERTKNEIRLDRLR